MSGDNKHEEEEVTSSTESDCVYSIFFEEEIAPPKFKNTRLAPSRKQKQTPTIDARERLLKFYNTLQESKEITGIVIEKYTGRSFHFFVHFDKTQYSLRISVPLCNDDQKYVTISTHLYKKIGLVQMAPINFDNYENPKQFYTDNEIIAELVYVKKMITSFARIERTVIDGFHCVEEIDKDKESPLELTGDVDD